MTGHRKLLTLPDRVRTMGSTVEQKLKPANPSGRDADPRRTIPLNSSRWQKLRAWVLSRDPLCRDCGALATDVDHDDGNPGNNATENLVPRCHACHSSKTMRERNGSTSGCDETGMPTSAAHPWNQKIAGSSRS